MAGCGVVVIDDDNNVIVSGVGVQGPPGPGSGGTYDHIQAIPAATWIIAHGLGHRVHVTLLDDAGLYVLAQVDQQAPFNTVTVTFPDPVTGSAHIS